VLLGGAWAGCAVPVSPEPVGDYTTWKRIDTWGTVPGHGDTYRIIYANEVAVAYPGAGAYAEGAIIVKEIYDNQDGTPGDLRYLALMRRLNDPEYGDEAGWLFSLADTPGGDESYRSLCWSRCHVAAPFAGAWLDYSK
jgi:hypothetical protein